MKRRSLVVLGFAAAVLLAPASAAAQLFEGRVEDADHNPVPGARVRINHAERTTTDAAGLFSVAAGRVPIEDVLVASSEGWLSARVTVPALGPTSGLTIELPAYPADRMGFQPEPPSRCARCHRPYTRGWSETALGTDRAAHSASALNPRVLDIWRGTASGRSDAASCAAVGGRFTLIQDAGGAMVERCYVGAGLLPDMNPQCGHEGQPACDDHAAASEARPDSFSDCAGCHTPGAAMALPEELDLDVAEVSPDTSSVTCAGCHRIAAIMDSNAPGILVATQLVRGDPALGDPLGLGPLDDAAATRMAVGYAPIFATSLLCAACHQDTYHAAGMAERWAPQGVPSEQTYAEWLETPYASGERQEHCQGCHMPTLADLGVVPTFPDIGEDGPPREPFEMHTHGFSALTDPETRAESLGLEVVARIEGGELVVETAVTNRGIGHGWPSGVTSRNAVLVISAELGASRLTQISGDTLPLYAGSFGSGEVVSVSSAADHTTLTLASDVSSAALAALAAGQLELRVWQQTTQPHPHVGWSVLRTLPLAARGLFRTQSLGSFEVLAVRGAEVDVRGVLPSIIAGSLYALGDDERLAGGAGLGFSKVNIAADGTPNVPFWRATDIVSDNRIAPDETQRSEHRFALPEGASGSVQVHARLLYRAAFVDLAIERGWEGNETLARQMDVSVELVGPDAGSASVDAGRTADAGRIGRDAGPETTPNSGCACGVGSGGPSGGAALLFVLLALSVRRRRRTLS